MAKISIVGAGPGSPDYITALARKTVHDAQVVIGAERTLNLFALDIKGEAIKLTAKNLNDTLIRAIEIAQKGKTVAVVSTGDPGFAGLLRTFSKLAIGKNVESTVVPGISAVQVCSASLQMPWDDLRLFSFHEGASSDKKTMLAEAVEKGEGVLLLPEAKDFSPKDVAKFLLSRGVNSETPVFVCENLTLSDERIVRSTLGEVSKESFGSLCVMVIKPSL